MIFVEETDERFYIKESSLPNAGYGCFAKTLLKKSDYLEVIGVYVKTGGVADQCTHYARRYKFASHNLDTKIIPFGYAAIINHSNDPKIQNCQIECVRSLSKRNQNAGQIIYRFLRDIQLDEEVVGNYGPNIDKEIKKISENAGFISQNSEEINEFLGYNLYNLPEILRNLSDL